MVILMMRLFLHFLRGGDGEMGRIFLFKTHGVYLISAYFIAVVL